MARNNALGLRALTDLSARLRTVDRQFANGVRKNLRDAIKQQGAGVLGAVKARASWSSRIPAATKLSIRYNVKGASVRIIVDHNKAPHARPYEMGNKNTFHETFVNANGGYKVVNGRRVAVKHNVYKKALKAGAFDRNLRHPVFHKVGQPGGYADEATRPFFFPAIKTKSAGIDREMEAVVIKTAHDAGFK